MTLSYDVVVVGAGPAGSVSAREFARRGYDTALLEKRREVGCPVRCAEGVGSDVEEFVDPDPSFITGTVEGAKIYSPDMTEITMGSDTAGGEVGYVLERKVFDRELVREAVREGADPYVGCTAKGVERDGSAWSVAGKKRGEDLGFGARLVVAADGVESLVGRWAGIDTTLSLSDDMSCAQYLVTNLNYDDSYTYFYFGNEVAPGGYAWVFPKGGGEANVGIGVQPGVAEHRAVDYLERFYSRGLFDGSGVVEIVSGGVPVSGPLEHPYGDGLLLVGDAARFSDPVTGGGIINAMESGAISADVGSEALDEGDVSGERLSAFRDRCMESFGEKLQRHYAVKEVLGRVDDELLDEMADALKDADFDKFGVEELVGRVVQERPELLGALDEALD